MARIVVVGRKTIGGPLIQKLLALGHKAVSSSSTKGVFEDHPDGSDMVKRVDLREPTQEILADAFDKYCCGPDQATVAFLAIPSSGEGKVELEYIRYFRSRGLYVILFSKGAFAYEYAELVPHLDWIGARAVCGARVSMLPWLDMHCLRGKVITLRGIINTSNNRFFTETGNGSPIDDAYSMVKDLHLAEPGSTNPVSFVNGEVMDQLLKMCAIYNGCFAPTGGPFVNPHLLGKPVEVRPENLSALTSPRVKVRPIVRITNKIGQELDFEEGSPGSLRSEFGGYEFSFGFCNVSGSDSVSQWAMANSGSFNAITIDTGGEGPLETRGIGAGQGPTIGAGLCDLQKYLDMAARLPAIEKAVAA